MRGAIGFGSASCWLKNWRKSFQPITKHSNRNHTIASNSHLKTAIKTAVLRLCSECSIVSLAV